MFHRAPTPAPLEWMDREERGSERALAFMCWLSLKVGRSASRLLLPFIALYFTLTAAAARRASRRFLGRCLGRRATWLDVLRNVYAFASTVHDRIFLLHGRRDLFDLRSYGLDQLDRFDAAHGGAFLFGAHLGSFEVLRATAEDHPQLTICMAMFTDNARRVNRVMSTINPNATQGLIELGRVDSMINVHRRLAEGALIGVLADRASGPDEVRWLDFLGEPAMFPSGPFRMAAILRRPVYFMTALYRGGNRYDLHVDRLADASEIGEDRQAAADSLQARYVAVLERHCRAAPYNWFNFFDFWVPLHERPH